MLNGKTVTYHSNFMTAYQRIDPSAEQSSQSTEELSEDYPYKNISLPFTCSFTVDYQAKKNLFSIELNSENAPNLIKEGRSVQLEFSPLQMKMKGDSGSVATIEKFISQKIDLSPYLAEDAALDSTDSNSRIYMKNGKVYDFGFIGGYAIHVWKDKENNDYHYSFYGDHIYYEVNPQTNERIQPDMVSDHEKDVVIDPQNIEKVVINGNTIYSA